MTGESQRMIDVIRQTIDQETEDQVLLTPGVIDSVEFAPAQALTTFVGASLLMAKVTTVAAADSSGMTASAYIHSDEFIDEIIVPAGQNLNAGDYAIIAISESGRSWIDRLLPTSIFAKMILDPNIPSIGIGDGESGTYDFGSLGQNIVSDGSSGIRWGINSIPTVAPTSPMSGDTFWDTSERSLSIYEDTTKRRFFATLETWQAVDGTTKYGKIASGTLDAINQLSGGAAHLMQRDANDVDNARGYLRWSIRANAMGVDPDILFEMSGHSGMASDDATIVIIQNTPTVVYEIYLTMNDQWESWWVTPTLVAEGLQEPEWHDHADLLTSLPSGTQTEWTPAPFGDIHLEEAKNIVFGTTTGTKIGTSTSEKIGFYDTTPVVQPASVADASGGGTVDTEARAAINDLLSRLRSLGVIAT